MTDPIRPLTRDWVAANWAQLKALSADLDWDYWDREHFEKELPRKWDVSVWVEENGSCAGYAIASVKGSWLWLHHIIVAHDARGRRLGTVMLIALEQRLPSLGLKGLRFKVPKRRPSALKFYESLGYRAGAPAGDYVHMHKLRRGELNVVSIHQPNYVPWAGYFHKMLRSDDFVFLDDALVTKNSFINRNRIKQQSGELWLTIPVHQQIASTIADVGFANRTWPLKHCKTLKQYYSKAPFFSEYFPAVEALLHEPANNLADLNIRLIQQIARWLEIPCTTHRSSNLALETRSDDRLIDIVGRLGGQVYLSGRGGTNYQSEQKFELSGIRLEYSNFQLPPYPQLWGAFVPNLSILDLLFNCGPAARQVLDTNQQMPEVVE